MENKEIINFGKNTFQIEIDAMKRAMNNLSDSFAQAVNIILGCKGRVVVIGMGKSGIIGKKIAATLASTGTPAFFMHPAEGMHGDLGMIQKKDLVLVLSKSGNTAESIILANYLVKRGDKAWAITFNKSCQLSRVLDKSLTLELKTEGDNWNIVPNNSSSVFLILLQGLALQLADKLGVTLMDFKKNHPGGAIGDTLKNVR